LFLVAVGLTLIHSACSGGECSPDGAFYMFVAYFAMTANQVTGKLWLGRMFCGAGPNTRSCLVFESRVS